MAGARGKLDRLRTLPAGRRGKWVVVAVWVVAALAFGPLQPKLQDVTKNDPASFLPASADSTKVLKALGTRFVSGRTTPALIVYRNPEGLTAGDRAAIAGEVAALSAKSLPHTKPVVSPLAPGAAQRGLVSADGTTAVAIVPITATTIDEIQPVVDAIRGVVGKGPPGLEAYVTGPAGVTVDAVKVFAKIDTTLLAATGLLVLILLLLIYRAPMVALVPLAVVAIAYVIAGGLVYLLVKSTGMVVNGQTTGILIILMFGAGTDYCLLIVSRFREELARTADKHEAMADAMRHTSPAILSSGATVVAAMLVLLVARLDTIRSSGPVLALGVAVTMLAGLTLLPALLTIAGRRAFWPTAPKLGEPDRSSRGIWRSVAGLVSRRPVLLLVACVAALAVCAAGNAVSLPGLSLGSGFRGNVESVQGLKALAAALPAGEAAETDVLVEASPEAVAKAAKAVEDALASISGIAAVRQVALSEDGRVAHLAVTLRDDPYSDAAIALTGRMRAAASAAAEQANGSALVGGSTAEEADTRTTVNRDERLIFPLILLVILGILVALLRALVAPLYLIASVILSFAATMGLSYVFFRYVFDSPGSDASLPVYVFLFVVALGVDYNIFLMARVREEAREAGSRAGVLRGLERTGGVITSAGVILAGTFLVLMVLPLEQLFQLGFAVALGVLIDTFVVRTLLVPSTGYLLGPTSWWPHRAR